MAERPFKMHTWCRQTKGPKEDVSEIKREREREGEGEREKDRARGIH